MAVRPLDVRPLDAAALTLAHMPRSRPSHALALPALSLQLVCLPLLVLWGVATARESDEDGPIERGIRYCAAPLLLLVGGAPFGLLIWGTIVSACAVPAVAGAVAIAAYTPADPAATTPIALMLMPPRSPQIVLGGGHFAAWQNDAMDPTGGGFVCAGSLYKPAAICIIVSWAAGALLTGCATFCTCCQSDGFDDWSRKPIVGLDGALRRLGTVAKHEKTAWGVRRARAQAAKEGGSGAGASATPAPAPELIHVVPAAQASEGSGPAPAEQA